MIIQRFAPSYLRQSIDGIQVPPSPPFSLRIISKLELRFNGREAENRLNQKLVLSFRHSVPSLSICCRILESYKRAITSK